MKRCYFEVKTSGKDINAHGILQIGGIIEIDNTIMDTFNLKCKPYISDSINIETMLSYDLSWEEWVEDIENLHPKDVVETIISYLDKFVDKADPLDKFQYVGFKASEQIKFLQMLFIRNGYKDFKDYFWFPVLNILYITEFILEVDRYKFTEFSLGSIANYFGFKIDLNSIFDPFYRVTLLRNLYHILEKFRVQTVYVKKAQLN